MNATTAAWAFASIARYRWHRLCPAWLRRNTSSGVSHRLSLIVQTLIEVFGPATEHTCELEQVSCRDPVRTALVLLDLLERQADGIPKLRLRNAHHHAPRFQSLAHMMID
jgi:hypothetical protein